MRAALHAGCRKRNRVHDSTINLFKNLSEDRRDVRSSARKLTIAAKLGRFDKLQAVQPAVLLAERH